MKWTDAEIRNNQSASLKVGSSADVGFSAVQICNLILSPVADVRFLSNQKASVEYGNMVHRKEGGEWPDPDSPPI